MSAARSCASSPAARRAGRSSTPSASNSASFGQGPLGHVPGSDPRTWLERPCRGTVPGRVHSVRVGARRLASYTGALSSEHSYAASGVSLATAGSVVDRLRAAVESTGAQGFGAFAGLHRLPDGRYLAASTDGVGTKLILARHRGRLRDCGADLAAHCINDVATCGAEPLMLLDYVAANTIRLEEVAELVEGAAEVCRAAGVALVGGETAELPGIYAEGELDFAGTCVGIVDEPLTGSAIRAGDAVIGFPSAGVHANGFTLVRRVLEEEDYDGDDLLAPTRLYLDVARDLRDRAKAFAHITGGGILGNIERVLPSGRTAEIDWDAWERPEVFRWLARHVAEDELRSVFNLGIGWCAVVDEAGPGETVIGRIT